MPHQPPPICSSRVSAIPGMCHRSGAQTRPALYCNLHFTLADTSCADYAPYRVCTPYVARYPHAMQRYRRWFRPGGVFFFTVVTYDRAPILTTGLARRALRDAIDDCRNELPFEIDAFVLLPDHLHCIWRLPPGDKDYVARWKWIKQVFSHNWLKNGGTEGVISASRKRHRRRGVLQRRYWEHVIDDEPDYWHHADYIHWNPVKHGLARCPHEWPYSTFGRWVTLGHHASDWRCQCHDADPDPPDFGSLDIPE